MISRGSTFARSTHTDSALFRYYLKELRRVLHRPRALLSFALAATVHALSHALVALVGSALALTVATRAAGLPLGRPGGWLQAGAVHSAASQAFLLASAGLAVVLVKAVAGAYATFVQVRVAGEVGSALRLRLFDALLALHELRHPRQTDQGSVGTPALQVDKTPPPTHAVLALTDRVRDVQTGMAQGLLAGARAVAQIAPLAGLLLVLAPRMALVAGLVLAAFGWVLARLRSGYRDALKRGASEHERLVEAADDSMRHADLWVVYGAQASARANVRVLGESLARGAARLEARAAVLTGANEVLAALALVGAIAVSRAGWLGPQVDGATLLAFAVAFFLTYRPLRDLADARIAWARAQAAYQQLALLVQPEGAGEPLEAPPALREAVWRPGRLQLRELRAGRGTCAPLSVSIDGGAIAVLSGPTGIGKTSLLRTLLGLERAAGGEIVFDGRSLTDAPAGPRSRPFTWVPQDAPLLADTLAANVGLGAPGVDPVSALGDLGAAQFARGLGGERIGAGGRSVSGGERQWIALARAIATRQPVLLLDEPTSGLDAGAQRAVLEAIGRMRGQRTVIIVTHRPEPLDIADLVVRLGDDAGPRPASQGRTRGRITGEADRSRAQAR